MLTEPAIVIRRVDHRVEVELSRASACSGCEVAGACGTGAIGRLLGRRQRPLLIDSDRELAPGDRVTLAMSEAGLVRASLLVYGLPLLGMLLFGIVAHGLFDLPEWQAVMAAAAGFYLAFRLAVFLAAGLAQNLLLPHIVHIEVNPGHPAGS